MSTIHDALKKVQDDMDSQETDAIEQQDSPQQPTPPHNPFNKPPAPPSETAEESEPEPPPKKFNKNLLIAVLSIVLVCGLGFAGTYLIDRLDLVFPKPNLPFMKKGSARAQHKTSSNPGGLVKGIMSMGDKNVALIANDIYEEGASFQGMKITKISQTQVTLIDGLGQEKVLGISK